MQTLVRTIRPTRHQTRERIMDCADGLFRQFGSGKTTVADIAQELRMSPANIYKFFPSKNAIIQAGAERSLLQIKEDVRRVAGSKKSATSRLLDVILAIYHFHREYFRNERQIYKLVISATEENWSCVCAFRIFLNEILNELIKDGIRTKEFRPTNPLVISRVLLDSFTWITNPILLPQLEPREVAGRARAQINLLEKALK